MKNDFDPSELPAPECVQGYPESQLREIIRGQEWLQFLDWMRGQTTGICTGMRFSRALEEYVEECDGVQHGIVYYAVDVGRFLSGDRGNPLNLG